MKTQLLKVTVQPHFVVLTEEGAVQEELVAEPVVVMAKDWEQYVAEDFPKAVDEIRDSGD